MAPSLTHDQYFLKYTQTCAGTHDYTVDLALMGCISNDCLSIAWALLLTTCKHLRTTAATAAHPCLAVMTSSSVAHVSSALNLLSCLPRRLLGMFQMQSLILFWYLLSAYLHLSCVSKTIPQATSSMTKCYPSSFIEPKDMFFFVLRLLHHQPKIDIST